MEYSGYIVGFGPSAQSLNYSWSAPSATLEFKGKAIEIAFFYEGKQYVAFCGEIKAGYYSGQFTGWNKELGKVFFWLYKQEDLLVIHGFWEEDASDEIFGKFTKTSQEI